MFVFKNTMVDKNKIEIALAADGGYFDQLFVTATSMATYACQNIELSFNILDGGIAQNDWNYLVEKVRSRHPTSTFNRIRVDESLFAAYPKWNGNRMAYARLLLPNVLKDVEWILYSDCDFLWLRDVAELWQERDEKFSVVAVRDLGSWENKERTWFEKNGYLVDGSRYFCSGMCLFNLKRFRDENLIHRVSSILSVHSDVPYVDQTALNVACTGSVKLVSNKWMCFTHELTDELLSLPSVIHYAGEVPWRFVRGMQQLSDTMMMWHEFNARIRGITRWQSLRRRFSIPQILWHRLLALLMRYRLARGLTGIFCRLLGKRGAFQYLVLGARQFELPPMYRTFWQIVENHGSGCNAGPKAPADIEKIVSKMGAKPFPVGRLALGKGFVGRFFSRIVWWFKCRGVRRQLPSGDIVLLQYPSAAYSRSRQMRVITHKIKNKKRFRLIVLIHDLASLRWGLGPISSKHLYNDERELFEMADKVIVHNDSMLRILSEHGIPSEKMIPLKIFDYLTDVLPLADVSFSKEVIIAGCLSPDKVGYLKSLPKISGVTWRLFGEKFNSEDLQGTFIIYEGCFAPEELPRKLTTGFGLIWDGESAETCKGCLGEYLRINNPHKLSLYLASGVPVLIWEYAAEAEFVVSNGLGVAIGSLYEIPSVFARLTDEDYSQMRINVVCMSQKLRAGHFTINAINRCLYES